MLSTPFAMTGEEKPVRYYSPHGDWYHLMSLNRREHDLLVASHIDYAGAEFGPIQYSEEIDEKGDRIGRWTSPATVWPEDLP
jgi:hypothetical protein